MTIYEYHVQNFSDEEAKEYFMIPEYTLTNYHHLLLSLTITAAVFNL